ncbi:MAG TPA: MFS transporter [Pseudomonadales bacterium]|nr:MFS transporter [Pseudomonadales bacterium]HNF73738.1 MFS transporter [Pseudomonadales bacterium]
MQPLPENPADPSAKPPFHGWRMVAIALFTDFISVGFFFYSYGIFFLALSKEFGGSHLDVSLGFMISNVSGALMAPFLGRALDRYPTRWIMLLGATVLALGYGLLSTISALWQFYLILATCNAFGGAAMGGQASSKLVAAWFIRKRGLALGIATMGISASGLVMPTLSAWLIDHIGWRGGYLVYCTVALLCVTPVVALLVRSNPEELGQRPDGATDAQHRAFLGGAEVEWSTAAILRSSNFWFIALTFALLVGVFQAILIHMVPQLTSQGLSTTQAAMILSVSAGIGVIGKVVFGWLTDHNEPKFAVWLCIITQLLGAILLMLCSSYLWLLLGGALFGFGMGGVVPLQSSTTGQIFGRLSFGRVSGLIRPAMIPLQMCAVPLAGWIYDQTGSYRISYLIMILALLIAAITIALVKVPAREPDVAAAIE